MKVSYLNDAFFSRLETLALNLKANLSGFFGGKHLVRTHGQTVEFSDYREYMMGDDIRRIDWNLYSRFEKYFLKLFTDERQMHVRIFLDCSASMSRASEQKGAYAIATAAAIGFLAVHNMDKVSYQLIRGNKAENPFGTIVGKNAFFRAIGELENVEFDGECSISEAVTGSADRGSNDGLTVIITDFFTDNDWKKAVDYLCYKKRQVLLIQVLSPEEKDPSYSGRVNLIDAESGSLEDGRNMRMRITKSRLLAYQEAMRDMTEGIREFSVSRGVEFISVSCDQPIEKMLFGELLKVGIMG
ncbi:MAG TPA: DUF58 domain-containing protein [Candidatus Scatosoma pullistercoris]|uniref:DUF58 domain-containing protein n=1 Tax=Candidatus Scatosoma pullistercoris TaxID=2840934 RepID=A0A9D1MF58_9FIRM|nr:DUF58 domain-containing protein [Candidatus Scatosoma pullistercoris]